jgi:hypothetical protein
MLFDLIIIKKKITETIYLHTSRKRFVDLKNELLGIFI